MTVADSDDAAVATWAPEQLWEAVGWWAHDGGFAGAPWRCRGELTDVQVRNRGLVTGVLVGPAGAQLRVFVLPHAAGRLRDVLVDGVSAIWLVEVEVKPTWGQLQLRVDGVVWSTVGTGDRALQIAAAWHDLEPNSRENRARPVPPLVSRVGVVAGPSSAGWSDFQGRMAAEPRVTVELIPTRMGGDDAAAEIVARLRSAVVDAYDVVVITRGGGDGRQWADDPRVAWAIVRCARQVWTAIGHTDDVHLADRVAAQTHATPTAAATHICNMWTQADEAAARKTAVADAEQQTRAAATAATAAQTRRLRRQTLVLRALLALAVLAAIAAIVWAGGR